MEKLILTPKKLITPWNSTSGASYWLQITGCSGSRLIFKACKYNQEASVKGFPGCTCCSTNHTHHTAKRETEHSIYMDRSSYKKGLKNHTCSLQTVFIVHSLIGILMLLKLTNSHNVSAFQRTLKYFKTWLLENEGKKTHYYGWHLKK